MYNSHFFSGMWFIDLCRVAHRHIVYCAVLKRLGIKSEPEKTYFSFVYPDQRCTQPPAYTHRDTSREQTAIVCSVRIHEDELLMSQLKTMKERRVAEANAQGASGPYLEGEEEDEKYADALIEVGGYVEMSMWMHI